MDFDDIERCSDAAGNDVVESDILFRRSPEVAERVLTSEAASHFTGV